MTHQGIISVRILDQQIELEDRGHGARLADFTNMIQLNNVFKFYRTEGHTKIVLDHVSAVFDSTNAYGLLGVNGAGKSTTLRLIAGTELPNSGSVRRSVRVSWPLGFAGGFHHLLTGRENVHFV